MVVRREAFEVVIVEGGIAGNALAAVSQRPRGRPRWRWTRSSPACPAALGIGHPSACGVLGAAAETAGARVLRGVEAAVVEPGRAPTVR
jgi:hypothetical protein